MRRIRQYDIRMKVGHMPEKRTTGRVVARAQIPRPHSLEWAVGQYLAQHLNQVVNLGEMTRALHVQRNQASAAVTGLRSKSWAISSRARSEYILTEIPMGFEVDRQVVEVQMMPQTQEPELERPGMDETWQLFEVVAKSVRGNRITGDYDTIYIRDEAGNLYRATLIGR